MTNLSFYPIFPDALRDPFIWEQAKELLPLNTNTLIVIISKHRKFTRLCAQVQSFAKLPQLVFVCQQQLSKCLEIYIGLTEQKLSCTFMWQKS